MRRLIYAIISSTAVFRLCYLVFSSPVIAQTDSIANERIPVKSEDLEAHWNVECASLVKKTERVLANHGGNVDEISVLRHDIKKCMYIYNTPDSAHYKAEPDYKRLLDKLNEFSD